MHFRFNDIKTAQAAAHLLHLSGGTMPYMVLIKFLYLADRQMLLDHGRTITGDRLVSMKNGPVLSAVLDLINHGPVREPDSAWFTLIDAPNNYRVSLKTDSAPTDKLSRYEVELLNRTYNQYGHMDRWKLVELLHRILPEWQNPGGGAYPIEYADILRAEDWSEQDIAVLSSENRSAAFLDSLG